MYLTSIEHDRREWTVHLTVVPRDSQPAALELVFRHLAENGAETTCTEQVTGGALHALYEQGNEFSQEQLRAHLTRALAQEECVDPIGAGTPAPQQRDEAF